MQQIASNFHRCPVRTVEEILLGDLLAMLSHRELAVVSKQIKAGLYATTAYDAFNRTIYRAHHPCGTKLAIRERAKTNPRLTVLNHNQPFEVQ